MRQYVETTAPLCCQLRRNFFGFGRAIGGDFEACIRVELADDLEVMSEGLAGLESSNPACSLVDWVEVPANDGDLRASRYVPKACLQARNTPA